MDLANQTRSCYEVIKIDISTNIDLFLYPTLIIHYLNMKQSILSKAYSGKELEPIHVLRRPHSVDWGLS